jgi:hypothetical protein
MAQATPPKRQKAIAHEGHLSLTREGGRGMVSRKDNTQVGDYLCLSSTSSIQIG